MRDIYRSAAGRAAIEAHCGTALASWPTPHSLLVLGSGDGETFALVAGAGPAVVLLPGTNFSTTCWLDVVAALARSFRVVALDLPGQPGLSSPRRPRDAAEYGRWLGEAMRALDLHDAVAVGHSFGAGVALAGAARGAPVRALALYNPAGLVRLHVPLHVLAATVPWLVRPSAATSRRLLRTMTTSVAPVELVTWMSLVGRHVRTSLAPAPLPDAALSRVRVPAAVVAGEHDPFLPPAALRRGADRLTTGRFVALPGAGHLLPHERPDHVVRTVRSLLPAPMS